ncbi:MAG: HEAT repeat domain-containing protein [Planctomycetes bacterium]|nr:HEAT repeat domain-containing protein [Planctomycetota bacterium]
MNFSLTEEARFFSGMGADYLQTQHGDAKNNWKPFMKKGTPPKWCRDRMVDVRHIKLEIAPDFDAKSIRGKATLTVAPIYDHTDFLVLDACEMEIESVLVDGATADFDHDGENLTVRFGATLPPDEPLEIAVTYHATPRRGAYFVGPDQGYPNKHLEFWTQGQDEDSRYWFPCFDYPNEKATSEVIARVPKGMTSLSNGALISSDDKGDYELHHWRHDVPHVAYLVMLVIGNYVKVSKEWDGIPVDYYVPPGREADGERSFGPTPEMVKFFSEKTGVRYPYAKYAQITAEDFIFGGMENTTATLQTSLTLFDERAALDTSSDPLNSHELAHQWFGDYVTCRDWSHAWLNESFATYFEAMWQEHANGVDEFEYYLDADWKAYLAEDKGAYRRAIQTNVYVEPLDLFDRHLYQKGAVILHHLRKQLGDRLWWKVINLYLTKHGGGSVITQDFASAVEEVTGKNYDWFFSQWIYGGGHPDFKLKARWDEATGSLDYSVLQKQKQDELTAIFRTPVTVRFVYQGGEEVRTFEIDKPAHRYHIKLPAKPKWISFDPGNSVPKTLDLEYSEELLINQLHLDDTVMGRIYAARALGAKPTKKSTTALAKALGHDKFWGVQAECAYALGRVHTSQALEALISATSTKHPKARRAVAKALGEFKEGSAAAELAKLLEKDESYYVAGEAALALGKTRNAIAFELLEKALGRESHNDAIRNHVFAAFCELRDMRALELIREWTAYGRSQQARFAAIANLGRLAHESTEDKDKTVARETIEPCLEGDFRTCLSALSGLQSLKDAKAIPAIAKLARTTHDSRLKKRAKGVIESIRSAQGSNKEVKELRDDYDKLKENYEKLKERLDKIEELEKEGKKPTKRDTQALKKTEKLTARVSKPRKPSSKKAKAAKKSASAGKPARKKATTKPTKKAAAKKASKKPPAKKKSRKK